MKKRITRPTLERNAPVRTWSTLFGSTAGGPEAAGKPGEPTGAMSAVQRGVEFAYRVSDEYLRQGQSFARALSQPFSASPGNGGSGDLPQLTDRMVRYTSELSTMWMEGLRMMSGNKAPGASFPFPMAAPPPPPAPAPRHQARRRVVLEVDSQLRTRASLDVDQIDGQSLAVKELRLQGGAARIRGVRVEAGAEGPVTVVVRVPARQTPATYQGAVVDAATSAPLGTVTVRVSR